MYSLIVSHLTADEFLTALEISRDRFLEYTSDVICGQLKNLSVEAIECLKAWPCVLMQEGRGEEVAHIVRISTIQIAARELKLIVSPVRGRDRLVNDTLWKVRTELDIAQFEFNRNHWSVKDRDLFVILKEAGHSYEQSQVSWFVDKPLPAPSRRELLKARDVVSEWSHTEIDDFLLEVGVPDLEAGRDRGSRRDRANAIIEYSFAHPTAVTAENFLLSTYIVRETLKSGDQLEHAQDESSTKLSTDTPTPKQQASGPDTRLSNRVFVVHGQNESARTAVASELERIGLEPIVLHEQPNMGRHLLTKFIDEAELVTFAVVLMTDDDVGSIKNGTPAPRARQNVILELGYFLSHLGQSKVCALITPGLETPSDFDGIVYIRMDEAGNWKAELIRELRAARIPLS